MPVLPPPETGFDLHVPVLVIGAGACGWWRLCR
jgi:fumarate reductase flavoprotein subunit